MVHQCVHCGKIIKDASRELLEGCSNCKSHFFFYIRDEQFKKTQEKAEEPVELKGMDKQEVEREVREMIGLVKEDVPVILDLESVKITGPGKFEIDVVNLFNKQRPLVYKLEEGKYIIDLASTLKVSLDKEEGK